MEALRPAKQMNLSGEGLSEYFTHQIAKTIMATKNCPTLRNILNEDMCMENFAGLGSVAYIFLKDDIDRSKLVAEKNVYKWTEDTFKEGKGFYRVELKENSQSFTGSSQNRRKGFKITGQLIIEVANEETSELLRALNNLDWGVILPDGDDKYQIMYSPSQKITLDADSLNTQTGAAASDDRQTTIAPVLENVKYPNLFVDFLEGKGPEDYLASVA